MNIKQAENEIRKGKDLEMNIPMYLTHMASVYGEFSFYNLAMNLSLNSGRKDEDGTGFNENNKPLYEAVLKQVRKLISEPFDPDGNKKAIEEIIGLRETIKHRMEVVTDYVDRFIIAEYMINRTEPKFEPVVFDQATDDELAREILRWIFENQEENAIVNERIRMAMSCLPIRFTKEKVIDMVNSTFMLYNGADKTAVDTFDYMLRSATGLYKIDKKYAVYKNVEELIDELEKADYSKLESNDYFALKDDYRLGTGIVEGLSDELTDLQDLVNSLLAVLLTRQYFSVEAENNCKKAIEIIAKILDGKDEEEDLFFGTEDRVEELNSVASDEEAILLQIKENYRDKISELMLSTCFERLLMTSKLLSNSAFANLLEENETTDPDYLEKVRSEFEKDLFSLLRNSSKLKNRAVTAQLLRELPVVLSSGNDVMNYVRNALSTCTDADEKQISMNLIRQLYD